jgi:hypothetical protein
VASGTGVRLTLEPYGGVFLRFAKARAPRRLAVHAGPLPGVVLEPLPAVEPGVGKGEFVQADISRDDSGRAGKDGWHAVGDLTKGNTDTFLFLMFEYPKPVSLAGADAVAFDLWTPDGQTTPTRFIAMLHDEDGRQYMASTARGLSGAGSGRVFVPLAVFGPAPWAKGPDGRLDLTKIKRVVIGWGGYLGREGEVVEFSTGQPMAVRRAPARSAGAGG